MGKYIVTNGQNLYDIALDLYGSVEGIVDLLINDTGLSLADDLQTGTELIYTDDFIINEDIVAYNRQHGIVPANGEQSVYLKYSSLPYTFLFHQQNTLTSVGFVASGSGKVEIDWGDNTSVETVELSRELHTYTHIFDNQVREQRQVRWYTDASFVRLDLSDMQVSSVFLFRPAAVEELVMREGSLEVDFLQMMTAIYDADLCGLRTSSLLPLLPCLNLMRLDLRGASVKPSVLDGYLMELVAVYGQRRHCEMQFSVCPSGVYQEPQRDENGCYRITSGMEAVWVITHEPAWNEGGAWKFIINNQIYTTEA